MGLTALIATTEFIDILERKKEMQFLFKKSKNYKKKEKPACVVLTESSAFDTFASEHSSTWEMPARAVRKEWRKFDS